MIGGFITLLVCQLAGEFAVRVLMVPVPGPVVGMLLLLIVLHLRRPGPRAGVVRAADALLRNLQLLFIPAGVGVIQYLSILADAWLPVTAGLLLSWLAVLLVTSGVGVGTGRLMARWRSHHPRSTGEQA
ncbi:MAG: CidA/LrgA family protein [Nakamurella sp.]